MNPTPSPSTSRTTSRWPSLPPISSPATSSSTSLSLSPKSRKTPSLLPSPAKTRKICHVHPLLSRQIQPRWRLAQETYHRLRSRIRFPAHIHLICVPGSAGEEGYRSQQSWIGGIEKWHRGAVKTSQQHLIKRIILHHLDIKQHFW